MMVVGYGRTSTIRGMARSSATCLPLDSLARFKGTAPGLGWAVGGWRMPFVGYRICPLFLDIGDGECLGQSLDVERCFIMPVCCLLYYIPCGGE
jgi:hypothetical protein